MYRLSLVLSLAACSGYSKSYSNDALAGDDAAGSNSSLPEVALLPGTDNRDIDLLFVIDDSATMLDKQANLKNSFPAFASTLASGAGLPNVHIGVITTDMGVKGADDASPGASVGSGPGACVGYGKDGELQTFSSTYVAGNFIVDVSGTKNYTGTLADAFSSIASAGGTGCGFEQPLHAMRRSFIQSANAGFIRETARLGIVVLADEDDCSIKHSTMFSSSNTAELGPLNSFRCTRNGVQCDVGGTTTDEMNALGPKSGCHSNEENDYMTDLGRYRTFLTSLKPDPRDVLFAVIAGSQTPVEVEDRVPPGGGTAQRAIKRSCMYTGGAGEEVADPAVRLATLADSLPNGSFTTVCNPTLSTVMTELAYRIKNLAGEPCITKTIAQPTRCEAWDVSAAGTEVQLPDCSAGSSSPCFSITADATTCPAAQNLKVTVTRAFPAGPDTWTSVRCAL